MTMSLPNNFSWLTIIKVLFLYINKGWFPWDWAKYHDRHSSKNIWMIKLSFCQKDLLMGESFWQNNRLVNHMLFELYLIMIFSPVANFGDHPLQCLLKCVVSLNETYFLRFLFLMLQWSKHEKKVSNHYY